MATGATGRWWLAMLGLFGASGLLGCAAERPEAAEYDGQDPPECLVDRDGDRFGQGCPAGPDCDDLDPTRAAECGVTAAACVPGEREACFKVQGASASTLSCGAGERVCAASGVWGHCAVTDEYEVENPGEALITGPEPCNPCNPGCGVATDLPDASDLVPGLNSEKLAFDGVAGGLVLSEDEDEGGGAGGPDADGDGTPDPWDLAPTDPAVDGYAEEGDLFVVLPFGGPAVVGDVDLRIVLRSADIYFLMDTTGSMQGEIDNLRTSLTRGNFLLDPTICGLEGVSAPIRIQDWSGQYFSKRTLGGSSITRVDRDIAFDWGTGSPAPGIPADNFSVRWTKTLDLPSETTFAFALRTDDGVRVRLDGVQVFDRWFDQGPTDYAFSLLVSAGAHTLTIEYYERGGGASANATVTSVASAPEGYAGLIGALRCQIADPAFGIGYFDDYPIARYGYSLGDGACMDAATGTAHDVPFHQLLASTLPANVTSIQGAVDRLVAKCGDDVPESHLAALYAIGAGAGLPETREGQYTTAEPVVVMTGYDTTLPPTAATPTAATGGPSFWRVDFDAGDVTSQGVVFEGDTTGALADHDGGCSANEDAPDHAYRFTVTRRTRILVDTAQSSFDTSVTLYRSTGSRVSCDDGDGGTHQVAADLDPGTYYAAVDGTDEGEQGAYRMYIGPVLGDTSSAPYDLGALDGRFVEVEGNTAHDPWSNHTGTVACWGGDKGASRDVVFRFTLAAPAHVVVTTAGTATNSVVQLRDAAFGFRYCHNGDTNQASIFQRLGAGTHYVVWSGSSTSNGPFKLGIGVWPDDDAYLTAPPAACPAGAFGYPCFRAGTIPIVVVFTDAEMHNGDGGDDRYSGFAAPSYMDAMTALNHAGAKVVGIHSGTARTESCTTECAQYAYSEQCSLQNKCTRSEVVIECWDESYCAERGAPVTTCEMETVCQQGGICWQEQRCDTESPCIRQDVRTECEDESVCVEWGQVEVCKQVRGDCLTWGATTCTTSYQESERDLRQLAIDTGSVNAEGEPFVYQINADGSGLSEAVVGAIAELSGSVRLDITLRLHDDADTPSVDERAFVKSIATVPTGSPPPETSYRCLETFDTWYRKCLPGTQARFHLGLQNDVVPPATEDQLFELEVDLMGDGIYVLETFRVVILVPRSLVTYPTEGRYWRDYDAHEFCRESQLPEWGELSWDADVPDGTEIEILMTPATLAEELDTAEPVSLLVPPGVSPVHVSRLLRARGLPANAPNLRVMTVLRSSADRARTPTLRGLELRWTCTDAD